MGMDMQQPVADVPGVAPASPRAPEDPAAGRKADEQAAKGNAAVEAYARGHEELTDENEQDALDYLLAPKPPRLYDVKVDYETEGGTVPLTFVIRGMDGRKIDSIEQEHVAEVSGRLDRIGADCHLVAEATRFLVGRAGHEVELTSQEFLTIRVPDPDEPGVMKEHSLASPVDALEARFKTQLGLISGVAAEVRRVAGYSPDRVSSARRRLVNAVGNS